MPSFEKLGFSPVGPLPNKRQFHSLHYKKAFFHFGVNTFTDAEWGDGTELEKAFNPTNLDIRQWMRVLKSAGFDLAIITAKHHDGFCLWPTKYSEHSVKNSPYKDGKGDIIKEFTDAAREYGIKAGIYLSPWDRHSEYWGTAEYSKFYAKQLTELMTNYGKLDEVWWDGAGSKETPYDWGRWASIIREHQPTACIFGSLGATPYVDIRWVGNESGYAGETHYASIDEQALDGETRGDLLHGKIMGNRYIPSECDVSIRPGWFYHSSQDDKVRSVENLNKIWFESVGRNSMMLLNFPPDRRGLICDTDAQNAILSHRCISKMLSVNYALGAQITADTVYSELFLPEKAALPDENLCYAAAPGTHSAVLDIVLQAPEKINTVILGEEIRMGERITDFRIEAVDSEGISTVLANATSVGFKKAVKIPENEYSHIRVVIENSVGPVVLNRLGLHFYENPYITKLMEAGELNLAGMVSAKIDFEYEKSGALINFGGIYPFNQISFNLESGGTYQIFAFSGTDWYEIASGSTDDRAVTVKLDKPIEDSYQIKIRSTSPFWFLPGFDVRMK